MQYLTQTVTKFMRDLQFLPENDTKDAQISQNSHKKCIVRLQEILRKKSV